MKFIQETKSFINQLQSSLAVDSDNALLLKVAIGKFIALNEWIDIDRIEAEEIDKQLIQFQIKLESKRRGNDLTFHPYEEISKLIALAGIENIPDSTAFGIVSNFIKQHQDNRITIPPYITELLNESISELSTKFRKPLQTTEVASSTTTIAHKLAKVLFHNDEDNIYTNAHYEYLTLLYEKRNTILSDLQEAFKPNKVEKTEEKELLRKIKDLTNIHLMVYEEDANNQAILNRYKSDLKHNSLLNELTNDFEALYLEGEIDFLKRIEGLLSNELNELKDRYNIEEYCFLQNSNKKFFEKTKEYFNTILDYKLDYIDEALSALSKFTNTTTELKKGDDTLSNFDSSDETNPLIFDKDLINGLHNNFRNFIFKTTDIDTFQNYFREKPLKIEKRDGITISELCYLFSKIEHHQNGVANFAKWMKNHIGNSNYGSKKIELIDMAKNAKRERDNFSLIKPQERALLNKEKIDDLFNLLNPIS